MNKEICSRQIALVRHYYGVLAYIHEDTSRWGPIIWAALDESMKHPAVELEEAGLLLSKPNSKRLGDWRERYVSLSDGGRRALGIADLVEGVA